MLLPNRHDSAFSHIPSCQTMSSTETAFLGGRLEHSEKLALAFSDRVLAQ
jgi:hypothetical protein